MGMVTTSPLGPTRRALRFDDGVKSINGSKFVIIVDTGMMALNGSKFIIIADIGMMAAICYNSRYSYDGSNLL